MAFIEQEDYTSLIRSEIKDILLEESTDIKLQRAEQMAIAQVRNYLAGKYDTDAIFSATGTQRNSHIVMLVIDCTLYHLYTSIARKEMSGTRANRYQDAIDWLKEEKSSVIASADLPKKTNAEGKELQGIKLSSKYQPSNNRW